MEKTARLDLPLLSVAQAAKEITVNEALTLLDAVVQPAVEGDASAPPPAPAIGQGWLIGSSPTGVFGSHANSLAVWTAGGWRYVVPFEGMTVWRRDDGVVVRWRSGAWRGGDSVSVPIGGSVIDTEARVTIETIVARIRDFGIIAV